MAQVIKHGMISSLIDNLEVQTLKRMTSNEYVTLSGEEVLILIEYARQCEYVIEMMDEDPNKAKDCLNY